MRFRKYVLLVLIILLSIQFFMTSGNRFEDDEIVQPNVLSYSLINAFPNLSFIRPVDFQSPNDASNKIYVVEQAGKIYAFDNNNETTEKVLYLDIESKVNDDGNEQGLLGLCFSPLFASDHYLYVYYTLDLLDPRSRVSRFEHDVNTGLADPNSEFVILEVNQPYENHNGGQIAFGEDGMLYIALGDGGSGGDPLGNGQDTNTLLGSLLRIDVNNQDTGLNYSIPLDNPFYGMANHREEIYAYGLRNPWRFSFDPVTNDIWLADVGQNQWEEVDKIVSGANYGWNTMEGSHCYNPSTNCDMTGLELPIFEYNHSLGYSITGGYVYRGEDNPGMYGKYVFGDYGTGLIWMTDVNTEITSLIIDSGTTISSFGQDDGNEIYVLSFDGHIYKFLETGYIPPITSISVSSQTVIVTTVVNDTTTTFTTIVESTTTVISPISISVSSRSSIFSVTETTSNPLSYLPNHIVFFGLGLMMRSYFGKKKV